MDKIYGGNSEGQATCDHHENPMADYKKPPPVVYNCEELEEDTDEFEICTIKKSLQNEEITQDEARVRLEPLEVDKYGRVL